MGMKYRCEIPSGSNSTCNKHGQKDMTHRKNTDYQLAFFLLCMKYNQGSSLYVVEPRQSSQCNERRFSGYFFPFSLRLGPTSYKEVEETRVDGQHCGSFSMYLLLLSVIITHSCC